MSESPLRTEPRVLPGLLGLPWARRGVVTACIAGTVAALAASPTAAAAPLPSECVQPVTGGLVTCTYTTTGEHQLTLPDGITSITITAIGGSGGDGTVESVPEQRFHEGGVGAVVTATVRVTSSTVYALVGGNGGKSRVHKERSPGGFNGGGQGGTVYNANAEVFSDGGGGGASDVRLDGRDLGSRAVVAAGGGGATYTGPGGDAGTAAEEGSNFVGKAGTATEGGAGGFFDGSFGSPGLRGQGGDSSASSGGGGGGGLFGGGGGMYGGGGGGSSLDPDGPGPALAARGTPPSVVITFGTSSAPPTPCSGSACLPAGIFGSS